MSPTDTLFVHELRPVLEVAAKEQRHAYATARPFPHAVFDDLFPAEILEAALAEWPGDGDIDWTLYDNDNERKRVCSDSRQLGPHLRDLLHELNSPVFVDFLEQLTGITGLVADPSFAAAGISDVEEGGFLNPHSDFLSHKRTRLHRRINVLLYLNHDWTDANGGQFELWAGKPSHCVESIVPTFNRMVVFNTTGAAVHGHPQKVVDPPGGSRKCVSTYYFSRGRPFKEAAFGVQGVIFDGQPKRRFVGRLQGVGSTLVPPVVYDAVHSMRRKRR